MKSFAFESPNSRKSFFRFVTNENKCRHGFAGCAVTLRPAVIYSSNPITSPKQFMALEITIRDAPKQDLERFGGNYVYRIRIELRPDITLDEAFRRRSIVSQADIRFLEFDLPASIVAPGCTENWQKAQAVMNLKRQPVDATIFLVQAAIKFGVLSKEDVRAWQPPKRLAFGDFIDV